VAAANPGPGAPARGPRGAAAPPAAGGRGRGAPAPPGGAPRGGPAPPGGARGAPAPPGGARGVPAPPGGARGRGGPAGPPAAPGGRGGRGPPAARGEGRGRPRGPVGPVPTKKEVKLGKKVKAFVIKRHLNKEKEETSVWKNVKEPTNIEQSEIENMFEVKKKVVAAVSKGPIEDAVVAVLKISKREFF